MAEPERHLGDEHLADDDVMTADEDNTAQLSRCYVHTVAFQDVGLVWSDQRRRALNSQQKTRHPNPTAATASEQELEEEKLELAALQELGLPSSFNVSKSAMTSSSHHRAQGAAWSNQPPLHSPQTNHLSNYLDKPQWIQAMDPSTGYFYYYNEALQKTQWEEPFEEYIPVDTPSTAWWMPPEHTNNEVEMGIGGDLQVQATEMEGVSCGEAVGSVSPYAEAVASYKKHHGWPEKAEVEVEKDHAMGSRNTRNDIEAEDVVEKLDMHLDQGAEEEQQHEQQQQSEGEDLIEIRKQEEDEGEAEKKPKARIETTGLLPHIPHPDPAQHMRFESSSSSSGSSSGAASDDEEKEKGMPIDAAFTEQHQADNDVPILPAGNKRPRRRQRRQRKVHTVGDTDNLGQIVVPPRLHKYWLQRYSLFSKYDQGVLIDEEGWYSVTPEVIAWHHAKRLVASLGSRKCLAVDAFGGIGGNSIQLALAGCHVIAIELDPYKASLLRHNTQVYGVEHLVEVICGDFLQVAPKIRADVVVLSPPWGGPEYSQKEKFDVESMGGHPELGLTKLLELSFSGMGCSSALVWLPRSSVLNQIERAAEMVASESLSMGENNNNNNKGIKSRCEVEIAALNGVTKAMTVYFGTAAKFRGLKQ